MNIAERAPISPRIPIDSYFNLVSAVCSSFSIASNLARLVLFSVDLLSKIHFDISHSIASFTSPLSLVSRNCDMCVEMCVLKAGSSRRQELKYQKSLSLIHTNERFYLPLVMNVESSWEVHRMPNFLLSPNSLGIGSDTNLVGFPFSSPCVMPTILLLLRLDLPSRSDSLTHSFRFSCCSSATVISTVWIHCSWSVAWLSVVVNLSVSSH